MRIGLLGPAGEGDREPLRDAIEFLLGDVEVEQVIYLGPDDDLLDDELRAWADERRDGDASEAAFCARAAELVEEGTPDEIEELLGADAWVRRLRRVRKLPPPPARAVEMVADRILLAVYDKSVLDEEDIANAHLIVYGRAKEPGLKKFGPRAFLTPGPLSGERVAVVDLEDDGNISLALFETSGIPVWRETMSRRSAKMSVAR